MSRAMSPHRNRPRRASIPPWGLPLLAGLLFVAYLASSGPAAFAVGRGWISWDAYHSVYSPIDEVVWGTAPYDLLTSYRRRWEKFEKRHRPPPLTSAGRRIGSRWVSLKFREPPRFVSPGDQDHGRLGGRGEEHLVVIDGRVVGIGTTGVRVDGRDVLKVEPTGHVRIESDGDILNIDAPDAGRYVE